MKRTKGEQVFDIINISLMAIFSLSIIFPFWQQLVLSLSGPGESMKPGLHLYTTELNFKAYTKIFSNANLINAYYWTTLRIVMGTVLSLLLTAMTAYPLSKKQIPFRNSLTALIVFTMFFSGGLIPTYFLVKDLNLIDTIWALILPVLIAPFNILLVRNFFMSLPDSLEESARIDGAKEMKILIRIMIPLSTPIMATVALWTAVNHWNYWFDALIYMNSKRITVVQIFLRRILIENQMAFAGVNSELKAIQKQDKSIAFTPVTIKAAILMVTTIPIICIYPFLQRYFVKGIIIGSLKG